MPYINTPASLSQMFDDIDERISRIETGYNGPQQSADAAQTTAVSAQSVATTAQIQAINAGIAANNAASQATIAQSQATIASTQATTAQTTANGKNTVTYSTSPAGSAANQIGDIWYQYGSSGTYTNKVIAQWSGAGGTSWTPVTVSGLVIANIDAGAITTGTLSAIEITAGSGSTQFHVSPSGVMSAQGVYVKGNITADSGTFNGTINAQTGYFGGTSDYWSIGSSGITGVGSATITGGSISGSALNIASGAFTVTSAGVLTATSGTIGGWTLSSTQIYSGTGAFMNASTGNIGGNAITAFTSILSYGSISTTSGAGIEAAGYIRANGSLYAAGAGTTTSTANTFINSSSGLIARSTSSQRYKVAIEEQAIPKNAILALSPKSYVDKGEADKKGTTDGLPRLLGVIAEDLAIIPVIKDLLVQYNLEGQPDAVNYDRIAVALIPLLKEHEERLNQLEAK